MGAESVCVEEVGAGRRLVFSLLLSSLSIFISLSPFSGALVLNEDTQVIAFAIAWPRCRCRW